MSKTMKNIPKLRFPEFRDAPEWEMQKFSTYIKLYRGSSPRPIQNYLTQDKSGVNWIKIGDTKNANNFILEKVEEKITPQGAKNSRKVEIGELILANSMSFGKTYELAIEGCIYDGWFVLREYEEYFYKPFLLQLLNSEHMQQQYQRLSAGGIVQNISSDIVNKTILFHTSYSEQQKIAECLSSLDALILAKSSKVEALKAHKKALMQQLFPAEGENTPRLRFPEFQNDGEWEENTLGGISIILRGGSPRPIEDYLTISNDGLNWLKIGDIDKDSKYVTFTQEKVLPSALSKTREVNPGDLILSNSMSFGRPYILKIKACIHDGWIAITQIDSKFDRDYLYYFISTNPSQTYFINNAAGAAVLNLNAEIIKTLPISAPTIKEQQKIAECLSSIDELISAQTVKVEALKQHKKALMQQLFPSAKEL